MDFDFVYREVADRYGANGTESWMRQQVLYDLARVEKKAGRIKVKRYEARSTNPKI